MLESLLRGPKVLLNGYNGAIINVTEEDLADVSALLLFPTTAVALEVASSSVDDVKTSGTGAWTIRVYGLDANYRWQTEDFDLNGQTLVAGVKTWIFVYGAEVLTSGTGKLNAGNIQVADAVVTWTAGVASDLTKVFAMIAIGMVISHCGYFCVPAGERYDVEYIGIQNNAQICEYRLSILRFGEQAGRLSLGRLSATSNPLELRIPPKSILLPAKTIIRLMASAATTGAIGACFIVLNRYPVAE